MHGAWERGALDELPDAAKKLLESVGAIFRASEPLAELRFSVHGASADDLAWIDLLAARSPGLRRVAEDGDLVIWLRRTGSLLDALAGYQRLGLPHLFLDLAFHHTISFGPLVWPGETACLQCLAGRIRHGWGDPPPPAEPLAAVHAPLWPALLVDRLAQFRALGSCVELVGHTLAIDLPSLRTRSERVHRLPWCPRCFPGETPYGTGAFALPWTRQP